MAWIYLAVAEGCRPHWHRGFERSPIVKQTDTAKQFFCLVSRKARFMMDLFGMTSPPLEETSYQRATLFSEDHPARTSARTAAERAWRATEASWFSRCSGSYLRFDRDSCSWKTALGFPDTLLAGSSVGSPSRGMTVDGTFYQLATWERPTHAPDSGLWPTPKARDWKTPGHQTELRRNSPCVPVIYKAKYGEPMPPTRPEFLMGYPRSTTALKPWAMQWYRSVRRKRSKDSAASNNPRGERDE